MPGIKSQKLHDSKLAIFYCFGHMKTIGKFLISEGNNARKIMRKILKIKLKSHEDDGMRILQIGCIAFHV